MFSILLIYATIGVFTGVLAGLFGTGGGLVVVPMLVFVFPYQNFPPELIMHMALGTSLASIIFTSISSAYTHNKHGGVDWHIVKSLALGILIGTYGGSYIASRIPALYLQLGFVCYLLYVATQMLFGKKTQASSPLPSFLGMSAVALIIGIVSSIVGIGGGSLSVPFMVYHNVDMRRAIGTSAALGLPIAIAGSFGYIMNGLDVSSLPQYSLGYIYLPALGGIVLLSILTAPYGARLAHRLPVEHIRKYFAIFMIVMACRMTYQAFKDSGWFTAGGF